MKLKFTPFKLLTVACLMFILSAKAQLTVTTFSYGTGAMNTNTGTIGSWTVPPCVTQMTIEVRGAQGGWNSSGTGGLGASMIGVFTVTPGQVLRYLVGKCPGILGASENFPAGGGGSYVALGASLSTCTPMIVAGGGGGGYNGAGTGAPVTTSGTGLTPGTGGNGGPSNACAGGGGGFFTNVGTSSLYSFTGGQAFILGGTGGGSGAYTGYQLGGFGGGATADYVGACYYYGGAGGGYSGGSAWSTSTQLAGSAGGSFNSGTSQLNTASTNTSHGMVSFTFFPGNAIIAGASSTAICSGNSSTLSVSNVSTYTWSTGSNATSIVVNPTSNTSYSVSGTNSVGCVTSSVITVNVTSGVPTLTITPATPIPSVCLGRSTTLTAAGAFTYTWTNGIINGVSFTPTATTNYVVTGQNGCGTSTAAITMSVAPLPVSTVVSPTTVCAGNIATLTAAAAATSYTWLPVNASGTTVLVSPIANTIYTVSVSDGTCSGAATVALNTVPVPTITSVASSTNICAGPSVTLTASGATSFTWNPGANQTVGLVLVVTPTASAAYPGTGSNSFGCTANTSQIVIVQPSPILVVGTSDPVICNGQSATLTISGASSYVWTPGGTASVQVVNPTTTTNYNVVGTGTNGCTSTATIDVNVFTPMVTITGNTAVCSGGTATMNASGAGTYTWDNGPQQSNNSVNPTSTTVYTVSSLTSTGSILCPSTNTFQVIVNPNPTVTAVSTRTDICRNESVTLTAGGAQTYVWYNAATTASIIVSSSLITTASYSVVGTNAQGCSSSTAVTVRIGGCTGVSENNASEAKLDAYPNPSNGELTIRFSGAVDLKLVNELGQLIRTIKLEQANNYQVNVSGLANGVYFINGVAGNRTISQKIVVNK